MENNSTEVQGYLDHVHKPERLDGETQGAYRSRQHMSRRVAERTTLLVASGGGRSEKGQQIPWHQRKASKSKLMRRALVKNLGHRQARKWLRMARVERRAQLLSEVPV